MRTNYSIKNSITSFIDNIVTIILLFIEQTIFIKVLGIEYSGLNGLFSNVLTLLNLVELGIGSAITYNLYKYVKHRDKDTIKAIMLFFKKAYNIIALIILLFGLSITFFVKYFVRNINIPVNIYIAYILFLLSTVATYIVSYKRNLIYADQKNYILNIFNIVYLILLSIVEILVICIFKNYYLYLIIKIISILILNILINIKANKLYPYLKEKESIKLDDKIKDNIIIRVKALIIHKSSAAVTNGTDNILISSFFSLTTLGLYSNYNYIISACKKIISSIISACIPSVGNLVLENNYKKNYDVFLKINFFTLWISIFTSSFLLIFIEPFIKLWLGNNYIMNKLGLIVLILNYFQTMMRCSYNVFKEAAGIWVEDRYIPLLQLSINLISSIILLKIIGIPRVFRGAIISSLVLWFYSYPKYVYKKLLNKTNYQYIKNIIFHIIIFILITSITYSINLLSNNIIVSFFIGIIIPNILLIIIYRNNTNFKYYLNLFKNVKLKK